MTIKQDTIKSLRERINLSRRKINQNIEENQRLERDINDCHTLIAKIRGEM